LLVPVENSHPSPSQISSKSVHLGRPPFWILETSKWYGPVENAHAVDEENVEDGDGDERNVYWD